MKLLLNQKHLIILIVVLAFILRLYKINNPVADWHAWRQADTASVTREFVKNGINLFVPKYHDLSSLPSGIENPEGYRMVEFPHINALIALFLKTFPFLDLVIVSRLFSALASLGTLLSLYFLVKKISGIKTALLSALIFAILPYSLFYSRAILPEPFLLFFTTFSLYQFLIYVKTGKFKPYLFSLTSLTLAFLTKPYALFLAPVYLTLIFQNQKILKDLKLYFLPFLSIIPFFLWRHWITNFPEGIPASSWLLNGNGIRLRPAWFRWLFYERLSKLFLGYFGLIFIFSNFLKTKSKAFVLYSSWWIGVILYFIVFATGNVQHDYYQNLALPIISISVGRGIYLLYQKIKPQNLSLLICLSLFFLMLNFSWQHIKGYYNINHWDYIKAGRRADTILPPDAKVIAPNYGGDTQFLFQTNRTGWPIGFDIPEKIKLGAQFYISTSYDDESNYLKSYCNILESNSEYIILDLTSCNFDQEIESTLFTAPTYNDVNM